MHITHTMYPKVEQELEKTQVAGFQLSMHCLKLRQRTKKVSWGPGGGVLKVCLRLQEHRRSQL